VGEAVATCGVSSLGLLWDGLAAVVEACLHEDDALVLDAVDHAVLFGEAARPYIWTQVLDRLGFADAPEGITADIVN